MVAALKKQLTKLPSREFLRRHRSTTATSRLNDAAMESWFSVVKFELGETFESIGRAADAR